MQPTSTESDSHDKLSGSHNGIRTRAFEAGIAAIAGGFRQDPQHCWSNGDLARPDQQPRRSLRECAWRQLHGSVGPIVLLTDAVTNACTSAVAFHTALALKEGIDPADVQAIREGRLPKDGKFAALSALAKTMIEKARTSQR